MSDEAFARRFYSDRAELIALGVPLHSQRDEFTGEELYTLRSENYFLAEARARRRRARGAADGALPARGQVRLRRAAAARAAEPRPRAAGLRRRAHARPRPASRCATRTTRPRWPAGSRSSRRRSRSSARSSSATGRPSATSVEERTLNPYALRHDRGALVRRRAGPRPRRRTARSASRASAATSASPPGASATSGCRPTSTSRSTACGRPGRSATGRGHGPHRGRAGTPPGGCSARSATRARSRTASSRPSTPTIEPLAGWVLRQNGRAVPLEPDELRVAVRPRRLRARAERHEGEPPQPGARAEGRARRQRPSGPRRRWRPSASPCSRRCSRTCSPPAATAAGRARRRRARRRASRSRREDLQEHLSLLNLVNFGGGCYTVYAELHGDTVRVDKELYGDVFRLPPRLTPLEARAIRLALEFVGPTIAADSHTPLERVRGKLEETFGQFELAQRAARRGVAGRRGASSCATLSGAMEQHRVVEIEYLKEGEEEPSPRRVEPYSFERELPVWRVHTWDPTVGEPAHATGSTACARPRLTDEAFEPREGFDPSYLARPASRASSTRRDRALEGRARRAAARGRPAIATLPHRARGTGSSARSSPTAARPSSSSPPTLRPAVARRAPASSRGSSASRASQLPAVRTLRLWSRAAASA